MTHDERKAVGSLMRAKRYLHDALDAIDDAREMMGSQDGAIDNANRCVEQAEENLILAIARLERK